MVDTNALEAAKAARMIEAKEREMEYKMELEKMMLRVQMQPTLFQRQSRVSFSISVKMRREIRLINQQQANWYLQHVFCLTWCFYTLMNMRTAIRCKGSQSCKFP